MAIEGGCRCGQVRYELALAGPPQVYDCHCQACQRWTGTAFSEQCVVAFSALAVRGDLATFAYDTPSGSLSTHHVCSACHARVFNRNTRLPEFAIMRAGTLDMGPQLTPKLHIWTSRKQPWVVLPSGVEAYPENAPQDAFAHLLIP